MKSLAFVQRNDTRSAVGDFSPVVSVLSYQELGSTVSPFLLLDHIGPGRLLPSAQRKGVHDHPHRGFETVTIVYQGEIEHRDSTGSGGIIRSGDVQWMTAASGVVHQEYFSEAFSKRGGRFEMIQLWVNLPSTEKMGRATYQSISSAEIPKIDLPDKGSVRIIAGQFNGVAGPAQTHSRMNVLDVQIHTGHEATFSTETGDTAIIYLLSGRLQFSPDEQMDDQGLAVMSQHDAGFVVHALEKSRLLVLTGERIDEPIIGRGPFVMNSYEEILQGYEDLKSGRFGFKTEATKE